MIFKFTEDGKKVEVIDILNSGDYFIVKKLLDEPQAPSEGHKKRTLEALEEDIIKLEKKKAALEENIRDAEYKSAASVARLKWIEGITDKEVIEAVENIKSMLSGEYTHVVFNDYKLEIKEWDIKLFSGKYDNRQIFRDFKMISLFGSWNGRLSMAWKVNQHSNGSGCYQTFYPCKSLAEALDRAMEIIYAKPWLSDDDYHFCIKYGIPVELEKNAVRVTLKTARLEKKIEKTKKELIEMERELNE